MRINEKEIERLALAITAALLKKDFFKASAPEQQLAARIGTLLLESMRQELALEEEAERLAERHARQTVGMDQRKIVQGIKERLAKERGFPL